MSAKAQLTDSESSREINLQRGFQLYLGALGQGLSEPACLRHAAWWSDSDPAELGCIVAKVYPDGVREERQEQIREFQFRKPIRSEANAIIDQWFRRNGRSLATDLTLYSDLHDLFEGRQPHFAVRCISERELYWEKKSFFHVFRAGRADPVNGFPERAKGPFPAEWVFWRGL